MIPRTNRQRLIGLAVLVVTFLAGGVAGAAIREVTADPTPAREARSDGRDSERRGERRFPFEYLGIEGEQRAQIEALFDRNQAATSAVWQEYKPRFDAIVDSTRAELNRLLTPEQREKFTEYRKRRRERQSESSDSTRGAVRN
ncbi:MAG TPA: hypothetical protein VFZ36_07190 [Vicinamibacterales bacterium]